MVKRLAYECRADRNANLIYRRSVCDSDEEDALKYACDTIDGDSEQNDGSADENKDEDEDDNQYFSVIPAEALDAITAYRDWLIRNEEIRILDMMKKFVQGTCSQGSYEDRKLCDLQGRESFQNSLQSHGLFNGPSHPWAFNTLFSVEEYCRIVGSLDVALKHEKCQEALEDDLNFDSVTTDSPLTVASYGDHNHRLDAVIQKGRLTGLGREWTHTGLARECLCESGGFHHIELR
ncbi:hypothetical protein CSOJ01_07273 [Colletotrichum sojae]|uniref:Uncharacterized protein n=1 Tax=Colletotrichum sojae TaxID=2175907 RepID=A0A8H6MUJ7_9PEZI|nr:hypothetical protein CSOJ01_07273 [Colletotrichum sojae]